jgi:quinoprotein glucose dehydrogenase
MEKVLVIASSRYKLETPTTAHARSTSRHHHQPVREHTSSWLARLIAGALATFVAAGVEAQATDWPVTGNDPGNTRYSPLDQITRENVATLRVAWTYHTGDLAPGAHGEIQATPIVIDGTMYTTTPALAVVALRADSGTQIWRFDPFATGRRDWHVNRGVVYWADGADRRILFTAGRRLYALDARTGRAIPTFGDSGSVDLANGLSRPIHDEYVVATSPGVIFDNLLIQGTRVGEEEGSAPGDIRAYDVRSGAIRWTFHTIPHPGEFGYDSWPAGAWKTAGGANSWPGMTVDAQRGIVYIPTGSATPDFYGGARVGEDLFANTLLALDARTGRRIWHYQTVHHDLWDRDLPAAPNLVTVRHDGARVDAVAQIAKSGFVFLFDRLTGTPLFPIEERPVPASDLRGEHTWPTQPFPTKPAPFARQSLTDSDVTPQSLARFHTLRHNSLFAPPSVEGTVLQPGFDGGGEWGGAAVDPETAVLYVNASDVPWIAAMRPTAVLPDADGRAVRGRAVYAAACASCHGADRRGRDRAPSLVDVSARLTMEQARAVIERGRGFMPSFAGLTDAQERAVVAYLGYTPPPPRAKPRVTTLKSPYEFLGYERWRDSSGYPAVKPPWGTLSAIDLNTGDYRWRITLGEHPELGERATGAEQYGGPIVTRGGLLFIAATQDGKFRAFDKDTGKLLWETTLPAPGYATPSTYMVNGTQYVVIAAGGGKLGSPSGDTYVAYSLP